MHLAKLIEDAIIVEASGDGTTVLAGSIVGITYEGDDEVEKYLIGSIEERQGDLDVISPGSPLGAALVGASLGDTVGYEAPGGLLKVTVASIE